MIVVFLLLIVVCCVLGVCSLFVVCRLLIVVARWLSFVACGLPLGVLAVCCLFVVWRLSFVVLWFVRCCVRRCMLCVVCSSLFFLLVACLLFVASCSLPVGCCVLIWGNVV